MLRTIVTCPRLWPGITGREKKRSRALKSREERRGKKRNGETEERIERREERRVVIQKIVYASEYPLLR